MANVDNVNLQDEDKNTLLHKSVLDNQLEEVKNLLKKGADASLVNGNGNTPLHDAVVKKNHQIVEAILKYSNRDKIKRFIDAQTLENNSTALHIAASNGCYESVSCLLSYGANFEVRNNNGSRPIDLAKDDKVKKLLVNVELDSRLAAEGKYKTLETRLKQYSPADLIASCYARNGKGMTSLQMAVLNNHCNTVRVIVDARVRLRSRHYELESNGMLRKIDEFIEHGKRLTDHSSSLMLHSQDTNMMGGETMVYEIGEILSAAHNIVKVAEKVFKPDNGEPYEQSGLLAVVEETLEVLQFKPEYADCDNDQNIVGQRNKARYYKMLYVNDGEDEDYDDFEDEPKIISYMGILQVAITRNIAEFMGRIFNTKLIEAAKNNDMEMFDKCIEEQFVDVNLYLDGDDARTPLHYAAEHGNEDMASKLLKKKAEVFWYTETNTETALYVATKKGHLGIVRMLLQSSGDDAIANMMSCEEGWTPVHVAAKTGRLDILKCLLEDMGTYDQEDNNGKRPVELADNAQVISFLKGLDEFFKMAKSGNANLVSKLKALPKDELLAVCKAHNNSHKSLAEFAEMNGHRALASQVSKIVDKATRSTKVEKVIDFDEHFHEVETYQLWETLRSSRT